MEKTRKSLSEKTSRLVEELYRPRTFMAFLTADTEKIPCIEEIGRCGEPAAIPYLVAFAIVSRQEVAEASARAIERLSSSLTPAQYVQFDQYARIHSSDVLPGWEAWYKIRAKDIHRLSKLGDAGAVIIGLATCHWNGYVRGEAVKELGRMKAGMELPFLLMRVNDWVRPVRELARRLLRERVRLEYGAHFLRWLPLVVRLRRVHRWDQSELIEAIDEMISLPEAVLFLVPGCESDDSAVRQFCFEQLYDRHGGDKETLINKVLADAEPMIRRMGTRFLESASEGPRLIEWLEQSSRDRSPRIRAEAQRIYFERFPDRAAGLLQGALLDVNARVREQAQFFAEKQGSRSLRAFYLETLSRGDSNEVCAAIAGLGEKGSRTDAVLVSQYLRGDQSRIRAAALRSLAKLDFEHHVDDFVKALKDESRSVAREARAVLARKPNSAGGERLWRVFQEHIGSRGKRDVLFLLARLTRWESLGYLLQALGDGDDEVSALSGRYLRRLDQRWNRSFTVPTAEQVVWLNKILDTHGLLVSETAVSTYRKLVNESGR